MAESQLMKMIKDYQHLSVEEATHRIWEDRFIRVCYKKSEVRGNLELYRQKMYDIFGFELGDNTHERI